MNGLGSAGAGVGTVERERKTPWWIPVVGTAIAAVALMISGCGLMLGPAFGAGVAVVGNYVTNQTARARSEEKLGSIEKKVDKLVEYYEERLRSDGENKQRFENLESRVKDAKDIADQALARATNAQINSKSK